MLVVMYTVLILQYVSGKDNRMVFLGPLGSGLKAEETFGVAR